MMLPLGYLILISIVAGAGLYLLGQLTLDDRIRRIIGGVIVFVIVILWAVWVLNFVGLDTGPVGKLGLHSNDLDGARAVAAVSVGQDSMLM